VRDSAVILGGGARPLLNPHLGPCPSSNAGSYIDTLMLPVSKCGTAGFADANQQPTSGGESGEELTAGRFPLL